MGRIAQAQRSAVDIFAHGENRAQGMRDDFVGSGAGQMGCGAHAARGVADAEYDQIGQTFFGCRKYPFGGISIFDERLWRDVKIGIGWNSFIKVMNSFGHGQLEPPLLVLTAFVLITAIVVTSIATWTFRNAHNVEQNQFGFVFLRQ